MLTVIVSLRSSGTSVYLRRDRRSCSTLARNCASVTCSGSATAGRHADLHRIVLAQRMALPVLRHQQPPQIRMAVEDDAEQIPDFALEPVGGRPHADDRRRRAPRRRSGEPSRAARVRCSSETRRQTISNRGARGQKSTAVNSASRREAEIRLIAQQRAPRAGHRVRATRRSSSADRRSAPCRLERRARLPEGSR